MFLCYSQTDVAREVAETVEVPDVSKLNCGFNGSWLRHFSASHRSFHNRHLLPATRIPRHDPASARLEDRDRFRSRWFAVPVLHRKRGCIFWRPWRHSLTRFPQTVYYKSDKMRELDTVLGDIHGLISDREIEIMHQLSEKILEYGTMLVKTCDLTAELDW